jgi:hypothetical protein
LEAVPYTVKEHTLAALVIFHVIHEVLQLFVFLKHQVLHSITFVLVLNGDILTQNLKVVDVLSHLVFAEFKEGSIVNESDQFIFMDVDQLVEVSLALSELIEFTVNFVLDTVAKGVAVVNHVFQLAVLSQFLVDVCVNFIDCSGGVLHVQKTLVVFDIDSYYWFKDLFENPSEVGFNLEGEDTWQQAFLFHSPRI